MSKRGSGKKQPKTWEEVFQSQRREFPQGYCVTRIIPDKRRKQPKHKGRMYDE